MKTENSRQINSEYLISQRGLTDCVKNQRMEFQVGELRFQVQILSLLVVVTVHGNQEPRDTRNGVQMESIFFMTCWSGSSLVSLGAGLSSVRSSSLSCIVLSNQCVKQTNINKTVKANICTALSHCFILLSKSKKSICNFPLF